MDRLDRKAGAFVPVAGVTYTFVVVTEPLGSHRKEPVAFPDGSILVSARMIRATRNEAELAGMLAHAMARIQMWRGKPVEAHGLLTGGATIPLIYMGGWAGEGDPLIPIRFWGEERRNEMEAERVAARVMAEAGYDPAVAVPDDEFLRVQAELRPAQENRQSVPPSLYKR